MTNCITCVVLISFFVTTLGITGGTSATQDDGNREVPVSHCPQVFAYETRRAGTTRYSASIFIEAVRALNGFKVELEMDRPVRLVGNDIADVKTTDNIHFVLSTRRRFPSGSPISLRIFVTHPVGDVGLITSIKIDDRLVCPPPSSTLVPESSGSYQITPRRVVTRVGDSVTLWGHVDGSILTSCQFFIPPTWQAIDLSDGRRSQSTPDYEYHGAGLEHGECGITIRNIRDDMDGVIESKIRREGEDKVENSATTLRVTSVAQGRLPVFNISPTSATLAPGDALTITCNTDRAINMCHIYLPGGRYLNYDQGVNSESTGEHRYHGNGLESGECGVTLTDVDERMNGFVVCKLGNWPEQNTGVWETDAMKIETVSVSIVNHDYQTEPRRALARPGDRVSLLGRVHESIDICHFYMAPTYRLIDLSRGVNSVSTAEYEYHGAGLDKGECGITLKRVHDAMDGIVESKIKRVSRSVLENCATTLRVTNVAPHRLPVFTIHPSTAALHPGDNITITCNTDKVINMCHIYLPGPRYLNLDMGVKSHATREYRYHGTGLEHGQCGVELTSVDERLTGFVVCKVGNWPEQTVGAWETDALKIKTDVPDAFEPTSTTRPTAITRATTRYPTTVTTRSTYGPTGPTSPLTTSSAGTTPGMPDLIDIIDIKTAVIGRPTPHECGVAIPPAVPLITRGRKTYQGQWPWHVALYTATREGNLKYICGGTLVGTKAMVTAGHCVVQGAFDRAVEPGTLKVFLGKHHLKQWSENGLQEKRIAEVHLHPGYNRTGYNNDIAILIFVTPVEYTNFVRPICLWETDKTELDDLDGVPGTVVGWGFDETGHETEELMMATMPIVKNTDCIYSRPSHFLQLSRPTTYCAGFRNGTSVCNGDSGGGMIFPIQQRGKTRWYLRGLTSVSVARTQPGINSYVCDPENFVIFTDVARYLSWITPFASRT